MSSGKITRTVARRALNARRANQRAVDRTLEVRPLTKGGTVSKIAINPGLDAFRADEREKAEARKAALEAMNPGRAFTIIDLGRTPS